MTIQDRRDKAQAGGYRGHNGDGAETSSTVPAQRDTRTKQPDMWSRMFTSSDQPKPPLTAAELDEWVATTATKRLQLHLKAVEPLYSTQRQQAFMVMSDLLQEAIEEVRVVSASLREDSTALRT